MSLRRVALFACAVAGAFAQELQFAVVPRSVIEQRLSAFTRKNADREPALRRLFEAAGCTGDALTEQPYKGAKEPNLICTLTGEVESEILVGAHFDLVEKGSGVVDNWSGASLLASLYQGLADVPRRHTFRFVGFSGEERGLLGSRAYVRAMEKTHESVAAMVNLDTLGLAETEVWLSRADLNLAKWLGVAASTMNLPVSAVNVDGVGSTDSESFRAKKIPAITIHSLTTETLPLLHGPKDQVEAIHMDQYYRTFRLVLAYLALLDQQVR